MRGLFEVPFLLRKNQHTSIHGVYEFEKATKRGAYILMAKSIQDRYRKLTPVEHVLARPGRYIGSVTTKTEEVWVPEGGKFIKKEVTWNPAILKMFDEIISNSVDFSKRDDGKHLNQIDVHINPLVGDISISDNGGIPVEIHPEYNEYVPEFIFGELRAGENFDDDEDTLSTGQNGEGSALVNILSTEFNVFTEDGKKSFYQTYTNNSRDKTKPEVSKSKQKGTTITWYPDAGVLGEHIRDNDNILMMERRVMEVAAMNPHIKVSLNGQVVHLKSFKQFIALFSDEFVYESSENFRVGLTGSVDGFQHMSYVNTTNTHVGGTHINYVMNKILTDIRTHIKKKTKIDVRPSDIKNQLMLFVDCDIVNPRYPSQTKDELTTEPRDYKTTYEPSKLFINKILKSPIVATIMDWVQNRQQAEELKELQRKNKENKKFNPRKVDKLHDATEKTLRRKCTLFITEGDSAALAIKSARDPRYMGSFALKGKPINSRDVTTKNLLLNKEFFDLAAALGLEIGKKVNKANLRYGQIAITTDQDLDGFHIRGLLINNFMKFWPEILEMGMVYFFNTPIVKAKTSRKVHNFYREDDYTKWAESAPKHDKKYYKGLGTSTTKDFKEYLSDMKTHMEPVVIKDQSDYDAILLAFDKGRSDDRKEWLRAS